MTLKKLALVFTSLVLTLTSSITSFASEGYNGYYNENHVNMYSGTGFILLREEPEVHYDDAYIDWRFAKSPVGKTSSTDYSDIVSVDDSVPSDFEMGNMNAYLDQIPAVAINMLRTGGWKIVVTTSPKAYFPIELQNDISGFCDTDRKLIVVPYDYAGHVVTHEIGHAVFCGNGLGIINIANQDWRLTNIGDPEAEIEKVVLHLNETLYYYYDALEKYAEVFGEYIYYPLELQATAPTIFKIYNDIFGVY